MEQSTAVYSSLYRGKIGTAEEPCLFVQKFEFFTPDLLMCVVVYREYRN
jgi:hypothetical protein